MTLSKTRRYAAAVGPWVSGLGLKRGVRETGLGQLAVDQLANHISMLMSNVELQMAHCDIMNTLIL